jgi:hypothetical protein
MRHGARAHAHADAAAWAGFMAGGRAGDLEAALRSAHDCCVVARRVGGCAAPAGAGACGSPAGGGCGEERRLVAVAEGDKDRAGLPSVMGQVDALCDAVCSGVFDGVA